MSEGQGNDVGASSGGHNESGEGETANNNGLGSNNRRLQHEKVANTEKAVQEERGEENSGQFTDPLTTSNLHKLGQHQQQQGATDDEDVESYVPPLPTTDERLEQAKIFLSDEDVNVNYEFARKHQEIDAYLRRISDEQTPCNAEVYREVKDMVFVHRMRMDKQKYQGNRPIDYNRLPKHSQRLGLRDTSERASLRGAPLREDHPPFTIERKDDQQEFLRAFRVNNERGRALRDLEAAAYKATLLDSALVNEYLEERAEADGTEDDKAERFHTRATKRGRHRAAVQIALRSFARNCEQHFAGGWDHRVVRLPPPPVEEPPEPTMFAPLDLEQRPRLAHPYRYTRRILQFQEIQRQLEERINLRLATDENNEEYSWLDFPNPSHRPTVVMARTENRLKVLALLTYEVKVKLGYQEIKIGNHTGMAARFVRNWVVGSREDVGFRDFSQQEKVALVLMYYANDPNWPEDYLESRTKWSPLSPQMIAALQRFVRSRSGVINETAHRLITRLAAELTDVWLQLKHNNLAGDETGNRRAALDALRRERRARLARRLRQNKDHLTYAPLRELAQPLNDNEAEATDAEAINLLSNKILRENNENSRPARVVLDEVWSFAAHLPTESTNRNFFSLEQWSGFTPIRAGEAVRLTAAGKRKADEEDDYLSLPASKRQDADDINDIMGRTMRQHNAVAYEPLNPDNPIPSRRLAPEDIGFVQVEESPQERIPAIGSGDLMPPEIKNFDYQRDGHVLENAPDVKENHQEGPPIFPFAETPFMQVLLGRQVADDMAPGTLDAGAQTIKADGIQVPLPTQQFSLPQPDIRLSADDLNDAGVFDQRMPLPLPRLDLKRTYPTSSPSPSDDEENEDKNNQGGRRSGRRGAKRRQSDRPTDKRISTAYHVGLSGTDGSYGGSNNVDNQSGGSGELSSLGLLTQKFHSESGKWHLPEGTQQSTTEDGTLPSNIVSSNSVSKSFKLGPANLVDNNDQPRTTKNTSTVLHVDPKRPIVVYPQLPRLDTSTIEHKPVLPVDPVVRNPFKKSAGTAPLPTLEGRWTHNFGSKSEAAPPNPSICRSHRPSVNDAKEKEEREAKEKDYDFAELSFEPSEPGSVSKGTTRDNGFGTQTETETITETGQEKVIGAIPNPPLGWWLDRGRQIVQKPFTPPAPTESTPPSSEQEQTWVAGGPIPFKIYPRPATIKPTPPRLNLEQDWTPGGPFPVPIIDRSKYTGAALESFLNNIPQPMTFGSVRPPTETNSTDLTSSKQVSGGPPPLEIDPPTEETGSTGQSSAKHDQTWKPNQPIKFGPAPTDSTVRTQSTGPSFFKQDRPWHRDHPITFGTKQETVLSNGEGGDEGDDDNGDGIDEDGVSEDGVDEDCSDGNDNDDIGDDDDIIRDDNDEDFYNDLFAARDGDEDDEEEEELLSNGQMEEESSDEIVGVEGKKGKGTGDGKKGKGKGKGRAGKVDGDKNYRPGSEDAEEESED